MNVVNHTTNEKCSVKYHAYSYFSRERQRKVWHDSALVGGKGEGEIAESTVNVV